MMQVLRAKIYGDSIMKGTILDDGYRYHAIMNEYLLKLYKRFGIEAENRSRFGITVERGHSILRRDIDEGLDCELALIEFGGNDSNFHWDKISLEPDREHLPFTSMQDFKHTMAAMTEELRAEGVQPVMMTLPPIEPNRYLDFISRNGNNKANILHWLGYANRIFEVHKSYSDAVEEIAKERMVPLVDVRSAFPVGEALGKYVCIDGIHPTEKGYALIGDAFSGFLKAALPA